jgi:hypothetical protein
VTVSLTCKNCDELLAADTEDALLIVAQQHSDDHARAHGAQSHKLSLEHLRHRLAQEQS